MPNSVSVRVGAPGAKQASSEVDQLRDRFSKLQATSAKFNASGGLAAGIGAAVTLKAFSLVGQAVGDVEHIIEGSVHAYREQEVASNRLDASLRANVAGWTGNTRAIRDATEAGIKLGFTDTETVNALSLLVAATHSETEALTVLGVAQDLARFKQISLADAAQALTSIEAGRSRGLAQLGINVKDYATTEERLAAVEKVVGGQARQYANSDLGRVDIATAKAEKAQERFGKSLSHLEAAILPAVADGLDNVTKAFFDLGDAESQVGTIGDNVANQIASGTKDGLQQTKAALEEGIAKLKMAKFTPIGPFMVFGSGQIDQDIAALQKQLDLVEAVIRGFPGKVADDLAMGAGLVGKGADDGIRVPITTSATDAWRKAVAIAANIPKDMGDAIVSNRGDVVSAEQSLHDALLHPLSRIKREAQLEGLLTGRTLARALKSNDPLVVAAAEDLKAAVTKQLLALQTSAKGYGAKTGKAYADGLESTYGYVHAAAVTVAGAAKTVFKASSPPGPESPLHEIDKWGEKTGQAWAEGLAKGTGGDYGLSGVAARFGGGPGGSGGAAMAVPSGGGGVVININGVSVLTPGAAEELVRRIEPIITRAQQHRGHLAARSAF